MPGASRILAHNGINSEIYLKIHGYKSIKYWHFHAVLKQTSLYILILLFSHSLDPIKLLILTAGVTVGSGITMIPWN